MNKLLSNIKDLFSSPPLLSPGVYPYRTPPSADQQYRLHLRVDENGEGLLIINASTVLHLNQTAAEFAYHFIQGTPRDELITIIANRYRANAEKVRQDYDDFREKIETLIQQPDLDPVLVWGVDRKTPYQGSISAPYRMDLALTYRLPDDSNPDLAPARRVDRELTTGEWKQVMDKAWQAGIPHITFTGGEPTLRDDLIELIEYAEKKGQVTGLLSDGLRFNDRDFLNEILLTGLDHLLFVLTPDQDRSWQALRQVLAEDLHTTVHLTLHPGLNDRLVDILPRLSEIGADALSLSTSDPENPDIQQALHAAQDQAADLGLPLKWDLPVPYSIHNPVMMELEEDPPRGAEAAWVYVEPDGDVLPHQGEGHVLGNLLQDSWDSIWPPD